MTDDKRRAAVDKEHAELLRHFSGQYGPIHKALENCYDAGAAHADSGDVAVLEKALDRVLDQRGELRQALAEVRAWRESWRKESTTTDAIMLGLDAILDKAEGGSDD
jgi:hypothetical protein